MKHVETKWNEFHKLYLYFNDKYLKIFTNIEVCTMYGYIPML